MLSLYTLLIAQRLDWQQARGIEGRVLAEEDTHQAGEKESDQHRARTDVSPPPE